jgi:hypothetical protein
MVDSTGSTKRRRHDLTQRVAWRKVPGISPLTSGLNPESGEGRSINDRWSPTLRPNVPQAPSTWVSEEGSKRLASWELDFMSLVADIDINVDVIGTRGTGHSELKKVHGPRRTFVNVN